MQAPIRKDSFDFGTEVAAHEAGSKRKNFPQRYIRCAVRKLERVSTEGSPSSSCSARVSTSDDDSHFLTTGF